MAQPQRDGRDIAIALGLTITAVWIIIYIVGCIRSL